VGGCGFITQARLGSFNAFGTTGGYNLLLAHNPYATGRYNVSAEKYVESLQCPEMNVFDKNTLFINKAFDFIIIHPWKTITQSFVKIFYLFMYDGKLIESAFNVENKVEKLTAGAVLKKLTNGPASLLVILNQIIYLAILFFIVYGSIKLLQEREYQKCLLLAGFPFLLLIGTLPALASTRFHYPIIIISMPLAAYGLSAIFEKRKAGRHTGGSVKIFRK